MSVTLRIGLWVLPHIPKGLDQIMKFPFFHIIMFFSFFFLMGKVLCQVCQISPWWSCCLDSDPSNIYALELTEMSVPDEYSEGQNCYSASKSPRLEADILLGSLVFTVAIICSSARCPPYLVNCIIHSAVMINKDPKRFILFFFFHVRVHGMKYTTDWACNQDGARVSEGDRENEKGRSRVESGEMGSALSKWVRGKGLECRNFPDHK